MCKTNRAQPTSDGAFSAKLAALAAMPARLAQIAPSIAPAKWKTRARAGGFSLQDHACHLRDSESQAYRVRLERRLVDATPNLPTGDAGQLAHERYYHRQDL